MRFKRKVCIALAVVLALAMVAGVVYAAWSGTRTVPFKVVVRDPDQGCDFSVTAYRCCATRSFHDTAKLTHKVLPGDSRSFRLYVHNTGECELIITGVTISDRFRPFELVKYEVQYTDDFPWPALGTDGEDYAKITVWYSVPEDTPPGDYQFSIDVTCERAPLS